MRTLDFIIKIYGTSRATSSTRTNLGQARAVNVAWAILQQRTSSFARDTRKLMRINNHNQEYIQVAKAYGYIKEHFRKIERRHNR